MARATARVDVERLLVSQSPTAELAAAAIRATEAAGLELGTADLVIVAVERGTGEEVEGTIYASDELGIDALTGQP